MCFVAANCAIGGDLDAARDVHSHAHHRARQSRGGRVGGFYVWVDGHDDGLADRPSLWHQRDVHLRVDDQQRRGSNCEKEDEADEREEAGQRYPVRHNKARWALVWREHQVLQRQKPAPRAKALLIGETSSRRILGDEHRF